MPFSINGTFTIINTFIPNTPILSADVNENYDDIADGLTEVWSRTVATYQNIIVFTSSDTYVPTDGLLSAVIECVGGGGGGSGINSPGAALPAIGAGGGGGEYSRLIARPGAIGASKTVTIGAGGIGGGPGAFSGANGSDTSVGIICVAKGGGAGPGGVGTHDGGAGGTGGTGDFKIRGGPGWPRSTPNLAGGATLGFGQGGDAGGGFGSGAVGLYVAVPTTGNAGQLYGGGGGGAASYNSLGDALGGAGADGVVVITELIGPT